MASRYVGYWPSVVRRDAKYHVTAKGYVRLVYRASVDEERHLEVDGHEGLVRIVNDVKVEHNGREGGVFYINEYGHVVVPVAEEHGVGCYYGGSYRHTLEFPYGSHSIGPTPPPGLRPGDEWPGPHVGIPYVLSPGGDDIRYEMRDIDDPDLLRRVRLSSFCGPSYARRLGQRLIQAKGLGWWAHLHQ